MLHTLSSHLIKGRKCSSWYLFIILALTIFTKIALFHYFCFHSILISTLWKQPIVFFNFWVPKLTISALIASFVFISKHKWWTLVVLLIIDLWCIANLLYFRANGLFIGVDAIKMAYNLNGYESAISTYWNYQSTTLLIITCIYIILIIPCKISHYYPKTFLFSILTIVLLDLPIRYSRYIYEKREGYIIEAQQFERLIDHIVPFRDLYIGIKEETIHHLSAQHNSKSYIYWHSIISNLPAEIIAYQTEKATYNKIIRQRESEKIVQPLIAKEELAPYISCKEYKVINPQRNLIFILVESLESWVINAKDNKGEYIAPNLYRWSQQNHILYCDKIKSQVREGVSGDGQLIYNTGLLPLQHGAACMLFGDNTYPNWAHFFDTAITFNPTAQNSWNQNTVTFSYGYTSLIQPYDENHWNDQMVVDSFLISDISINEPKCYQIKTISMHTPFHNPQNNNLDYAKDTPKDLKNYMSCVHYTDSCIGVLLNALQQNECLQNTDIVITGDHTIFKESMLYEFKAFAQAHDLAFKDGHNYVPLLIYSPIIEERLTIDDVCYQMDIYSTIRHLIGADNYYWKGFGSNLLDSVSIQNRPCTEQEAYRISDILIRSNYFSTYNDSIQY